MSLQVWNESTACVCFLKEILKNGLTILFLVCFSDKINKKEWAQTFQPEAYLAYASSKLCELILFLSWILARERLHQKWKCLVFYHTWRGGLKFNCIFCQLIDWYYNTFHTSNWTLTFYTFIKWSWHFVTNTFCQKFRVILSWFLFVKTFHWGRHHSSSPEHIILRSEWLQSHHRPLYSHRISLHSKR